MNLKALFDEFQTSAFRLERLPAYCVPQESEALAYFRTTGEIPSGFNTAWAETVRSATARGRTMCRLRLLSDPLSEYERFELQAYNASLEAGEDIRVGRSGDHPPFQDFWLFDKKWLALMNYDTDGAFQGADVREATAEELETLETWQRVFEAGPKVRDEHPLG